VYPCVAIYVDSTLTSLSSSKHNQICTVLTGNLTNLNDKEHTTCSLMDFSAGVKLTVITIGNEQALKIKNLLIHRL
jgi:hypothetical protein